MDAIRIGKFIKDMLMADHGIDRKVRGNIFPLVAKEGTLFPFIIYSRQGVDPSYTKDKSVSDTSNISIEIIDNTYEGANALAVDVFNCLQGKEGELHGFNIRSCRLMDASETFDDAYIQTLIFNIETEL